MKYLSALLATATLAAAATGDIVSVTIHSEGWKADVVVDGLSTGGSYNWGLGANNDPATGTPKVVFTVVSKGFDATGAATTISRTVYGTDILRQAYPNQASLQESGSSPVTLTIALSDYIYQKDNTGAGNSGTAPTVSFGAGWYTQGTASNAVTGLAVTNNSTREYPLPSPIAAWAHPDRDVVTGNTMTLRAVAFDRAARNGQPVRAVKYTVTDESADSVTTTVTAATVDGGSGDAVPVVEYVGTLDVSSLTQGDVLTANFQVYPWVGDVALDSSDAVNTNPSANYAPQKWLLDRTGGYGGSEAFVDPVSGTAGGTAVALGAGDEGSTPAFQTVLQAVNAIAARNNSTYSRNSTDRSIIYLKEGTHAGIGSGSITGGLTTQKTYLTIAKAPSAVRGNVILTSGTGAWTIQQYLKLSNVTLGDSSGNIVTGHTMAWADQCYFNQTTANRAPLYSNTLMYVTRSKVDNLSEGLMPYGAINATFALIRGNDFTDYEDSIQAYCVIGNKRDHGAGTAQTMPLRVKSLTSTQPLPQHPIIAFNKFLTLSTNGSTLTEFWLNEAPPTGYVGTAVVQNLFEQVIAAGSPIIWLAADGCQNDVHNAIVWHNTSLGQRNNLAYNDAGSTARYRYNWSVQNNIADNWNIKTDTFTTADGARVGNWATLYGVGYSGNVFAETSGVGAAGQFPNEFAGLKAIQGDGSAATSYLDFSSRQAATGSNGSGNGTYTLGASSAALNMQSIQLLPYDLAGNPRGSTDSPGAYTTYTAPPPPASTLDATTTNATTITIGQ